MSRIETYITDNFELSEIKVIAEYGCSGGISGLTYYYETRDFYIEYQDDIEEILEDIDYQADELNERQPIYRIINGAVWTAIEVTANRLVNELEEEND